MKKDFDGEEWAKGHKDEFRDLIAKAKLKRTGRAAEAKDDEGTAVVRSAEGVAHPGEKREDNGGRMLMLDGVVDDGREETRPCSSGSMVDLSEGDAGNSRRGTPPVQKVPNGNAHHATPPSRFLSSSAKPTTIVEGDPIEDPILESDGGESGLR
jgi:hypothetical protein